MYKHSIDRNKSIIFNGGTYFTPHYLKNFSDKTILNKISSFNFVWVNS